MSNNQVVIDTLIKKREQLKEEQMKMNDQFADQINEIDAALEKLTSGKVGPISMTRIYDDESPDYIRSSQEEI